MKLPHFITSPQLLTLALVSLVLLISPISVFAQSSRLETLQNDYLYEYEQYRQAEERFYFERAEYQKLKTLASREDAVEAMKNVMIARAKVLNTYVSINRFQLEQAQSLEPEVKSTALAALDLAQTFLTTHATEVPNLFDQQNVVFVSSQFESEVSLVYTAIYRSLSLVNIDRLLTAHNSLTIASNDFNNNIINTYPDEVQKASAQRGHKEVAQLIQNSLANFSTAFEMYSTFETQTTMPNTSSSQLYGNIIKELNIAQSSMKRATTFLLELEQTLR